MCAVHAKHVFRRYDIDMYSTSTSKRQRMQEKQRKKKSPFAKHSSVTSFCLLVHLIYVDWLVLCCTASTIATRPSQTNETIMIEKIIINKKRRNDRFKQTTNLITSSFSPPSSVLHSFLVDMSFVCCERANAPAFYHKTCTSVLLFRLTNAHAIKIMLWRTVWCYLVSHRNSLPVCTISRNVFRFPCFNCYIVSYFWLLPLLPLFSCYCAIYWRSTRAANETHRSFHTN